MALPILVRHGPLAVPFGGSRPQPAQAAALVLRRLLGPRAAVLGLAGVRRRLRPRTLFRFGAVPVCKVGEWGRGRSTSSNSRTLADSPTANACRDIRNIQKVSTLTTVGMEIMYAPSPPPSSPQTAPRLTPNHPLQCCFFWGTIQCRWGGGVRSVS